MNWQAKWIKPKRDMGDVVPVFAKEFKLHKELRAAHLFMTAMGIYEAKLNGHRVSRYVLAPGWTSYEHRLQYQEYDVTEMLQKDNQLKIFLGKGWYRGILSGDAQVVWRSKPAGLLLQLELIYADGQKEIITTDESWNVSESEIRYSELYHGEICDATYQPLLDEKVEVFEGAEGVLIPQEGEEIIEQEILKPAQIITTPKGEVVVDFGQEITGYVEISLEARAGERVRLSHSEMPDKDGNFYNANYRSAKADYIYICKDGKQSYHPRLTFYGFRYIRVDEFPGGPSNAKLENFRAIVVYSDIKRTGYFSCSNPLLNQLFSNVIWGQKDNFLDIPMDCPQRDERLGWTGDAQIFARTAALNFDVEKFYAKWLSDMCVDQYENGLIPQVVPDIKHDSLTSAAWGDAATICPWEIYMAYGNPEILEKQFQCMKKYVDYISSNTAEENLWIGHWHYGDWLGLDAEQGSYEGSSRKDLIASAYYAYSTSLLVKAGKVIGQDVSWYEALYHRIVKAFQKAYPTYKTQTECAIAVHFRLAKDCQAVSNQLARLVKDCGMKLQTGFVGTPYILHALSDFGHEDVAYSLLLRTEYPSWLYPVTKGATTMWEHWDSIMENGDFWSDNMNSFNHYLYGSVIDWVYTVAAGIKQVEGYAGYQKVRIAPLPDERLDWLKVSLDTRNGQICSEWKKEGDSWCYEITTPVEAEIVIGNQVHRVQKGSYRFYTQRMQCALRGISYV